MKIKRLPVFSRLFHAFVFAMALNGVTVQAAEPLVVRIGVATQGYGDPPVFGGSPDATAQLQHRFEDALATHGVQVKWLFFKGAGPAVNEALSNNQLDFADQGDLPAVLGRANGIKSHIIAANGVGSGVYLAVPPGSNIKSVRDLKGKRVALFRGTNMQLVADNILEANGLTERDLHIVNLDSAATQAALVSKGVDAGFLDYSLFKLQQQGLVKIIYASRSGGASQIRTSHLLVLNDFEQAHPDVVQWVVTALVQAAAWSSDENNRQALFALWSKSGTPVSAWQQEFDQQSLSDRNTPRITPFLTAHYQKVADQALTLHLIRAPLNVSDWFESKYVDQAVRTLKLDRQWPLRDANGHVIPG
jgi:sulfonate transport system substrate-binding protein